MRLQRRAESVARPPSDDPGNPRLVELLRDEIAERGPITFARFMQRALYEPGLGYYSASVDRPTRAGDFVTAPELHPIFGHALARQLQQMWQRLGEPEEFVLREFGAGSGALIVALAEGLRRISSPLLERLCYRPVDLPAQLRALKRRLHQAGFASLLERRVRDAADGGPVGCLLANEFLDALPVHRVVQHEGELHELYVGWRDDAFVEELGPLSSRRLGEWFAETDVELAEGQRAEVNLAMVEWLSSVAVELERGYLLIIDYGAEPAELYARARAGGTLRAFRSQHVSADPLRGVGRQDITAHVDLNALLRAGNAVGLTLLGRTTQAEFLLGCGLEELLVAEQEGLPNEWEPRLLLRSAVGRLLDPRALGGHAVVILGRDVPEHPPLRGLAYRLRPGP